MPWHDFHKDEFRDPSIPKLANLDRASRAGLRVPPTAWAWADDLAGDAPHVFPDFFDPLQLPCIIRSGSPTEDTAQTSNAGRFLSVVVRRPVDFPRALAEVIAALPRKDGRWQGVVFVQPLVEAVTAGVTFFDGFYF